MSLPGFKMLGLVNNKLFFISISESCNSIILTPFTDEKGKNIFIESTNVMSIDFYGKNMTKLVLENKEALYFIFFNRNDRVIFSHLFFSHKVKEYSNNLNLIKTLYLNHKSFRNKFIINSKTQLSSMKFYYFKHNKIYDLVESVLFSSQDTHPSFFTHQISLSLKAIDCLYFNFYLIDFRNKFEQLIVEREEMKKKKSGVRTRHLKYFQERQDELGEFNYEDEYTYPETENFNFEISLNKFFCSRQLSYIHFLPKGKFVICNSNDIRRNVFDGFITYSLSNIQKLESFSYDNLKLNILIKDEFNNSRVVSVSFTNLLDKFVFRSLVYQHLLNDLHKGKIQKKKTLFITCITWNLSNIDLPNILNCFNKNELEGVDVIAIGVQECALTKKKGWIKHLKTLMNYYGFLDVASIDMWQMFLITFVKKELYKFVDNIFCESKAMGFGGVVGNKGGMVIGFKLVGYQFVFVNCHLAPKPYKVLERNKMVKELTKLIKLNNANFCEFDVVADYTFWLGDMNYRIDYSFDQTIETLTKNKTKDAIKYLLEKDQLRKMRRDNAVFYNFMEPEINFIPTYRRKKKKDKIDTKEEIKKKNMDARRLRCNSVYKTRERRNTNSSTELQQGKTIKTDMPLEPVHLDYLTSETDFANDPFDISEIGEKFEEDYAEKEILEEEKNEDEYESNFTAHRLQSVVGIEVTKYFEEYQNKENEIREYSNKQAQSPSWCDRILVKTSRTITDLFYSSLPEMRYSDHLPVEAKYKIELTSPIIMQNESKKYLSASNGYFKFKSFTLQYVYILLTDEMEGNIMFPITIDIECYFELNRNKVTTSSPKIRSEVEMNSSIKFKGLILPYYPQLLFDYPHGHALNIYFCLKLNDSSGKRYDIGYGKYSLELVEQNNLSAMNHNFTTEIIFHTRKVGSLGFSADYLV